MRLGQIRKSGGGTIAAVFENDSARPIPGHTLVDLIRRAEGERLSVPELAQRLASRHPEECSPYIPLYPVEVWACGCTYERSASFRDGEIGGLSGMYAAVYTGDRPEIFFKGTARVCVGPNQNIGIRPDSTFTAPEPELAVVLGSRGKVLGYTLANDVSAWDIERQNALYLPQSKVYSGCCSLGPVMVTPDELTDPYGLEMTCTIMRGDEEIFTGSVSTAKLHRKCEKLIEYLLRANPVPAGSVLLTGTGIIVPESGKLLPGDVVRISVPEIGVLSNTATVVKD